MARRTPTMVLASPSSIRLLPLTAAQRSRMSGINTPGGRRRTVRSLGSAGHPRRQGRRASTTGSNSARVPRVPADLPSLAQRTTSMLLAGSRSGPAARHVSTIVARLAVGAVVGRSRAIARSARPRRAGGRWPAGVCLGLGGSGGGASGPAFRCAGWCARRGWGLWAGVCSPGRPGRWRAASARRRAPSVRLGR